MRYPLLLVALLVAVLAGSVAAPLQARSIPDPNQKPAPGNARPRVPIDRAGYSPAVNYQLECAGCHRGRGQGAPSHDIPVMTGFVGNFLRVKGGRDYLLRVPGVAQSSLSDSQLADLLNWLLKPGGIAGASTPRNAAPYTAGEVTRIRHTRLDNLPGTRDGLIREMRAKGITIDDGMSASGAHDKVSGSQVQAPATPGV